jgi:Holliday junction resolvase-like predicted endonuclease
MERTSAESLALQELSQRGWKLVSWRADRHGSLDFTAHKLWTDHTSVFVELLATRLAASWSWEVRLTIPPESVSTITRGIAERVDDEVAADCLVRGVVFVDDHLANQAEDSPLWSDLDLRIAAAFDIRDPEEAHEAELLELVDTDRSLGQVAAAFNQLRSPDRAMLWLTLEGMPLYEIAALTGMSPKVAAARLARIRGQLRRITATAERDQGETDLLQVLGRDSETRD